MPPVGARGPTPEQIAYLRDLSQRAGRPFTHPRSQAQAGARIEVLQARIRVRTVHAPQRAPKSPLPELPPRPRRDRTPRDEMGRALAAVKNAAYRLADATADRNGREERRWRTELARAEQRVDRLMAEGSGWQTT